MISSNNDKLSTGMNILFNDCTFARVPVENIKYFHAKNIEFTRSIDPMNVYDIMKSNDISFALSTEYDDTKNKKGISLVQFHKLILKIIQSKNINSIHFFFDDKSQEVYDVEWVGESKHKNMAQQTLLSDGALHVLINKDKNINEEFGDED